MRVSLIFGAVLALAPACGLSDARADGYRPPGGVLPLHRGGDNQASFPPLSTVGVEESGTKPIAVSLAVRCYPNPVRGASRFRVRATAGEEVRVRLHSVNGRLVREWREVGAGSGWTEWIWDGRDARGRRAAPGLYFYRAESQGQRVQGKLVVLGGTP